MPVAFNRVRINGSLPGGEVWSVNPCFMGDFGSLVDTYADLQAWVTAIAGLYGKKVVPDSFRNSLSALVTITSVRAEYYNAQGVLGDAAEFSLTPAVLGSDIATKPYQTAVVLSLLTGRPGRSYRGRLFWPAMSVPFEAGTLRMSTAYRNALATEGAQWLTAIAAAAPEGSSVDPAVVSQTLGVATPITAVRVGDILDVQRRRRDALVEVTTTVAIQPG